jgi:uncharacterized membrane-anchored protein
MSRARVQELMRRATDAGLLPADAQAIDQDLRPWPVVLLTALGAWLAAIPLTIVVGIAISPNYRETAAFYVVGLLTLAGAIAVLRSKTIPLFFEQMAVPGLIVGACCLGYALFEDLHWQAGAACVAVLAIAVAVLIPRAWLRVLLGAAAATLLAIALVPQAWRGDRVATDFWWAWHAVALLAGIASVVQHRIAASGSMAKAAAAIDAMAAGSVLAVLVALSWWSGMAFLVGASLRMHDELGGAAHMQSAEFVVVQAVSAALAAAAAAWLARSWPSVRKPWCAGVAAVLVALSWFMPALGAALLVLALCAAARRWMMASAAAVACAWIASSFYYGLEWPLATKALLLVGAGAVLAALAWFASGRAGASNVTGFGAVRLGSRQASVGIALTLAAVLAVANVGIWQKEQLARSGGTVFVELAPRDPRSLMQGDFMSLNFRLPIDVSHLDEAATPRVVLRKDARGVARIERLDDGSALSADELAVALSFKDGRWIFVTDAWFFKEGDAQRYASARFGEFRVTGDGKAMLVGLRGANLEPL